MQAGSKQVIIRMSAGTNHSHAKTFFFFLNLLCLRKFHKRKSPQEEALIYKQTFSSDYASLPWQFLYFLPLPQGQGSLRPIFGPTLIGSCFTAVPPEGS